MSTQLPVASILPQEDIEEGNNSSNSDETLIIENNHMQPVVYAQSIVEIEPVETVFNENEIVETVFNEVTYSVFNNNFTENETNLIKIIVLLISSIVVIPFIVCDLYFALNDITCQHEKGNNIKMNLSHWLIVCSVLEISSICITYYLVISLVDITSKPAKIIGYYNTFSQLFGFSWLVTGSILFSREVLPNGNCNKSISSYITAKLILGFIGQIFGLYGRYISKNQE